MQKLSTALLTVQAGLSIDGTLADPAFRGRLMESAIGAHLANAAAVGTCELFHWRELNREVDFVLRVGRRVTVLEVKSGRDRAAQSGMTVFTTAFKPQRALRVGGAGRTVERFPAKPVEAWAKG